MIKEMSKVDCVQDHTYGKCHLLPLKSTCYHKHSGSTTPSPTCINDGVIFKKKLTDTVEGNMSQETLDGVTALYMKHAAGQNGSASENAQNIIVDVINYFYQRAQLDKRSGSSQVNDQSSTPDAAPDADTAGPQGQRSGDTELAPSSGGDCNSLPNSVTETVKVSRSFNCTPEHFDSSQGGGSKAKRRRLSTFSASANNGNDGCTVASRTRALYIFLLNISFLMSCLQSILRKKNVKRLASRLDREPDKFAEVDAARDNDDFTLSGNLSSQYAFSKPLYVQGDGHSKKIVFFSELHFCLTKGMDLEAKRGHLKGG